MPLRSDGFDPTMPRFFCPAELHTGELLELPAGAARHVQVLRLQPGDRIVLFNHGPGWNHVLSPGGEFEATITRMGRSEVQVMIGQHQAHEREAARSIHLAVGMPANDRMDWLVEKATEIGVTSIQPLMGDRSVLRLTGERADKKVAHWQSVATAACEQCGGNRVPHIHAVTTLDSWLKAQASDLGKERFLLSLSAGSRALNRLPHTSKVALFLSGPEGGWSPAEEASALACGFTPVSLGTRVLRSETAALVALTALLSRE
jgi:16S rRNA (uracil1498-N3)-methyltransferase